MQNGRLIRRVWLCFRGNAYGVGFYSTTSTPLLPPPPSLKAPYTPLFHRISSIGDPKVSIIPLLDDCLHHKRPLRKDALVAIIKMLRRFNRFTHALQISTWMADKSFINMTSGDVAIRIDLILKVHGVKQVESYFNNVPQRLKGYRVYGALLNCYAHAPYLERAEALLQRMRNFGFKIAPLTYNVMLGLYYRTGNMEKLEALRREMDVYCIKYDRYAYTILISAYAAVSDFERMEKTLVTMEAAIVNLDWATYAHIATAYRNAGILDKALELLKKSEKLITKKERKQGYDSLITQYATAGSKDEALRVWNLLKKEGVVYNTGYTSILTALLKFDDIETAEKIFEEWESKCVNFDIRIPNCLICYYCRKGLLEKAESLVNKLTSKCLEPDAYTCYHLAKGYLQNDQTLKAVETMKQAIQLSRPNCRLHPGKIVAFLEHFKGDNSEKVKELRRKSCLRTLEADCWTHQAMTETQSLNAGCDATRNESGNEVLVINESGKKGDDSEKV